MEDSSTCPAPSSDAPGSISEPPLEPIKPPEKLLVELGQLEALFNRRIKSTNINWKELVKTSGEYFEHYKSLVATKNGEDLSVKYKIPKRLVALILTPLLASLRSANMPKDSSQSVEKFLTLVINFFESIETEMEPMKRLNYLQADYFYSPDAYNKIFSELSPNNPAMTGVDLPIKYGRIDDFLFIVLEKSITLEKTFDGSPLVGSLARFLSGKLFWQSAIFQTVQKILSLPPDLIAKVMVKLSLIPEFFKRDLSEYYLKLAVELSKDYSVRLMCPWLIKSGLSSTIDFEKISLSQWSEVCQCLNSLKYTSNEIKIPSFKKEDFFLLDVLREEAISMGASSFEDLKKMCSSGPVSKYISYDKMMSSFKLGPKILGEMTPEAETEETDEEEEVFSEEFLKKVSLKKDVEDLMARKQTVLSSVTLKQRQNSSDDTFKLSETIFIVDTNILISNPDFFESVLNICADILVPAIVLEELVLLSDHVSREKSSKAQAALGWLEKYNPEDHSLSIRTIYASGRTGVDFSQSSRSEPNNLCTSNNDDLILKICQIVGKQKQVGGIMKNPVVLSDDLNMRLKAKYMGIKAMSGESFVRATFFL